MSNILTKITRSDSVESIHKGHIAVTNYDGETLYGFGDPTFKTFFRSALKPIQAAIVLESGAIESFKINEKELAIIAASHSGEPRHIQTVESILRKTKIPQSFLHCGKTYPMFKPASEKLIKEGLREKSIYHNCSGKHAGLLAAAKILGPDYKYYFSPNHEIQRKIFKLLVEYSDEQTKSISFGVDGCGLPNVALPLNRMAIIFARIGGELGKTPVGKIGKIMSQNPWFIGGTKRFDTELMDYFDGRLIAKGGAEGLLCISIPEEKNGIVIKSEDGSHRPLAMTTITVLQKMGIIKSKELESLKKKYPHWYQVLNSRKEVVGEIIPNI